MNTKLAQTEPEQIKKEEPVRMSGILVHPTSFPSPYGIGDLGPGAYDFIDFLAGSGQTLWQVLPLGPTGFGDSPYQGFSAFAGQPLIISPDLLIKANLLTKQDIEEEGPQNFDPRRVDYGPAIEFKTKLLKRPGDPSPTRRIRPCLRNSSCSARRRATGSMTIHFSWPARTTMKAAAGLTGKRIS